MSMRFRVAERGTNNHHLALLRWSMVAIFIWFGIQKFTPYAADSIAPLISHSPFISWLNVFGVIDEARIIGTIELLTAAILTAGSAMTLQRIGRTRRDVGARILCTIGCVNSPPVRIVARTAY